MPNAVFPPSLIDKQDSKHYSVSFEDSSLKTKMEGGYVATRRKHTRTPRKTFKTGFTMLKQAEKDTLVAFYNSVGAGAVLFDWKDPSDLVVYQVRFVSELSFTYVGIGAARRYDVQLTLEQV